MSTPGTGKNWGKAYNTCFEAWKTYKQCNIGSQCEPYLLQEQNVKYKHICRCIIASLSQLTGEGGRTPIRRHREYWMIYKGPGFLAVVLFGSSSTPFPRFPVSKLSLCHFLPLRCRSILLTGGGWGRSQIISGQKSWSTINHSKKTNNRKIL